MNDAGTQLNERGHTPLNIDPGILLPSLLAGILGGLVGAYIASPSSSEDNPSPPQPVMDERSSNPFRSLGRPSPAFDSRPLEERIAQLEQKLALLETEAPVEAAPQSQDGETDKPAMSGPVTPSIDKLVEAGISPDIASDILRRMGQQEYRRLELQNLISRSSGSVRRNYQTELREINRNRISLRSELGDDTYDQYLYSSGQSNRVQVNSVMSGSPAETAGFELGDVILSYGGQRVLSWPDIRRLTRQGEIGSYVDIEVLRDGQRMSIMVPRGTLGVQLDAVRLDPEL